ncbi:MAG: ATP-binding protein [Syntrophobacteraceae bacterium]|nr:ATP-binding protein [Syntrophobacteraceae bacterium]
MAGSVSDDQEGRMVNRTGVRNNSAELMAVHKAFSKTAQYLASLTAQQDLWTELAKSLFSFFGADVVGFGDREPQGEIRIYHLGFRGEEQPFSKTDLEEMKRDIADVLESGFLTTRLIEAPEPRHFLFLPMTHKGLTNAVLVIGHYSPLPFTNQWIDAYLSTAAIAGTMFARLNAEKALLEAHEHLENRVRERTAELRASNESLQKEVAERRKAEDELKSERDALNTLMDGLASSGVGVSVISSDFEIISQNQVMVERFGESAGRRCYEVYRDREFPCNGCHMREALRGGNAGRTRFDARDGRTYELFVAPLRGSDRTCNRVIEVFGDVTALKRAEAERLDMEKRLQKLEKVESLARMAGSIAHHFNNKLGAVLGNLELALFDLPEASEVRASIVESMKAAHQAADVSLMMLAYLGQTTERKEPFDLVETVRDSLQFSSASTPRHVSLKTDFPPLRPIILGNKVHINQILTNLVSNAVEAMDQNESGITVAIQMTLRPEIEGLRLFPIDWEPKAAQYACLSVSDTGCGMDVATQEKIFDPFFSTKFTGRGLGLSVLLGLVRAHDGAITVKSSLGRGTTFRVFFPLHSFETVPLLKKESPACLPIEKGGLILLVEDDPGVRNMAETMLKRMGYKVLAASNGPEAVKLFKENPERVRFVITDLTMPGMDGWETLAALRKIRPHIPVVLASGHDEAYAIGLDHADTPHVFLHKPYSMSQLEAAIDKALQGAWH